MNKLKLVKYVSGVCPILYLILKIINAMVRHPIQSYIVQIVLNIQSMARI